MQENSFLFLRHGETDWNSRGLAMGQKDIPLNSIGISQALEAAKILKKFTIEHIATSSLVRAEETARIVNQTLNASISIHDELRECSWGDLEGQARDNIVTRKDWLLGACPPNGESFETFKNRVLHKIEELLILHPTNLLVVAHGGVFLALQAIFGTNTSSSASNCSVLRFSLAQSVSVLPFC